MTKLRQGKTNQTPLVNSKLLWSVQGMLLSTKTIANEYKTEIQRHQLTSRPNIDPTSQVTENIVEQQSNQQADDINGTILVHSEGLHSLYVAAEVKTLRRVSCS